MSNLSFKKRLLTFLTISFVASACVNDVYDLGNVSLKITLGPHGITLPLGRLDSLTVDTLVMRSKIEDLVLDDGFFAYKLSDTLDRSIDAIQIDPIRNVVPDIEPVVFQFSEGSLPESIEAEGFQNSAHISLPSFDLSSQKLENVSVSKYLDLGNHGGLPVPDNTEFTLPTLNDSENFSSTLTDLPVEIKSIQQLDFTGTAAGASPDAPIRVNFSLDKLIGVVKSSRLSFTITLPSQYSLALVNTYGGAASVNGSVLTMTDYPISEPNTQFVFYLVGRTVTEPISAQRTLTLQDDIRYSLTYTGISNGQTIPADAKPLFSLEIAPRISDATLVTDRFESEPHSDMTLVTFEINNLKHISEVNYIAFTDQSSNALTLHANHDAIPLEGVVPIQITFPEIYDFASGIEGLSGNVLNTTLDRLSAAPLILPLKGLRLSGPDAAVLDGSLKVSKPIRTLTSPSFRSGTYRMSALDTKEIGISINAADMTLHISTDQSVIKARFSEPVDIDQQIDQSFSVPDEVGAISIAQVADSDNNGKAYFNVTLDIQDSPVDHCYFDNIDIVLPAFLSVEHADLDPATHTVHIDRTEYRGEAVTIARIEIDAIKDIPVEKTVEGKQALLKGAVHITATVSLPDGTQIEGLDQTDVTLLPSVQISPLKVTHVTGKMDIDLQKYLEPTTIDLDDIRESLGDQDVELNLIAPVITLAVSNPVGVTMIGDMVLQPYNFKDQPLDPVIVKDITVEPAVNDAPRITRLFVSDLPQAPDGYTLCRVEDLSKLVKTIPSKIDVTFDLQVDDTREQHFAVTGEDYPLSVDYDIKLPLKFKDNARIEYSDSIDVSSTFEKIADYEITAEDLLVTMKARTTLPLKLDVKLDLLDSKDNPVDDVRAVVLNPIEGYDPATDGEYKESLVDIRLEMKDGNVQLLKNIATIRYTIEGNTVGTEAGLAPEQYVTADMKLRLKKGISLDLNDLKTSE